MTTEDPGVSAHERPVMQGRCINLPDGRSVHAYQAPKDSFLFEFKNNGETVRLRLSFDAVMAMNQLAIELSAPGLSA